MKHIWRIKKEYFRQINSGQKTVEVRVGYGHVKKVRVGDTITFENYPPNLFEVVRVTKYADFPELLDTEDSQRIIPGKTKYQALDMLQAIYPEDKESLGVYAFELRKAQDMEIISLSNCLVSNHNLFSKLVSEAYMVTDYICKDYPKHFQWYWEKTVPALFKGTREILICMVESEIAGVAFLKNEDQEKKICKFLVLEKYRGNHIASRLLERSFKYLGTTKPLITIADYKLPMFEGIIKKYGWVITQKLEKGYYNNDSHEIVFNGKI